MSQAIVANNQPIEVNLKKGQKIAWCTCGRSKDQPYCDGSHRGTDFKPLMFNPPADETAWLCQCKHTKNPPYCDGSHKAFDDGVVGKALAEAIGVPSNRINAIVRGTRNISADTDLRLARYFSLSIGFWLRLQQTYDLMEAQKKAGTEIKKIKPHAKRSSEVAA